MPAAGKECDTCRKKANTCRRPKKKAGVIPWPQAPHTPRETRVRRFGAYTCGRQARRPHTTQRGWRGDRVKAAQRSLARILLCKVMFLAGRTSQTTNAGFQNRRRSFTVSHRVALKQCAPPARKCTVRSLYTTRLSILPIVVLSGLVNSHKPARTRHGRGTGVRGPRAVAPLCY